MADEIDGNQDDQAKQEHRIRTSTADELLEKRIQADEAEARSLFMTNLIFMILFLSGIGLLGYALFFEKDEERTILLLKVGVGIILTIPAALLIKSVMGIIKKNK